MAFASAIGTTVGWYDFFIYGTAAALVFKRQFFPEIDPLMGTLAAFATFGVGFIARPVGGVVFGHFGDRVGRKSMLMPPADSHPSSPPPCSPGRAGTPGPSLPTWRAWR